MAGTKLRQSNVIIIFTRQKCGKVSPRGRAFLANTFS